MKTLSLVRKIQSGFAFLIICIGAICIYSACVAATPDQITSFGSGKIKVRLYADYFCGPCKMLEPMVEPYIKKLVKNNVINITFIDTPFHKHSSLYAKYFLFALKEKHDFNHALYVRALLFEATKENLTEAENIEGFLKKRGVKVKMFDVKPVFSVFEGYINREDNINSTPTCIVERNGKKEIFKGRDEILKAFESLTK